jgi:hypothetical protein
MSRARDLVLRADHCGCVNAVQLTNLFPWKLIPACRPSDTLQVAIRASEKTRKNAQAQTTGKLLPCFGRWALLGYRTHDPGSILSGLS